MTIRDACQAVLDDYVVNSKRSLPDQKRRIYKHLLRHLDGAQPLTTLATPDLLAYARRRIDEGATPASVNREVAILRRGFRLAGVPWPHWTKLREAPPRQGFFEREELARVLNLLPERLRPVVEFMWLTGWRKGEVFSLQWKSVDFTRGEIHTSEMTKNGDLRRPFPLYPRLRDLLLRQQLQRQGPYVFHRHGKPIRKMYGAWRRACNQAGVPSRLLHDFRRTAARNLVQAGVDRKTAMTLLGHKTESIFTRYQIVDGSDLQRAGDRLDQFLREP